jgi:hypothetical protein
MTKSGTVLCLARHLFMKQISQEYYSSRTTYPNECASHLEHKENCIKDKNNRIHDEIINVNPAEVAGNWSKPQSVSLLLLVTFSQSLRNILVVWFCVWCAFIVDSVAASTQYHGN